jgi:hypothetical protein
VKRLWLQFTLAFTVVILVAVTANTLLINRTTITQFVQYVTHSGMRASGSGIQRLVDYYEQNGSWDGVENLLAEDVFVGAPGEPSMHGPAPDTRAGRPPPRLKVVLVDADWKIAFDSNGRDEGKTLDFWERPGALPITGTDDQQVFGYLVFSPSEGPDRLRRSTK